MTRITDAHIAQIRRLAAQDHTAEDIARLIGCTGSAVRYHARARGIGIRAHRNPQQPEIAQIRLLAEPGLTAQQIARELGISDKRVRDIARRAGIQLRRLTTMELADNARRMRAARRPPVCCPAWVPEDLRGDYRDLAHDLGVVYAGRAVRKLMDDAAVGVA